MRRLRRQKIPTSREDPAVDYAANRLRIATKIHFAVRRYLGEGLDVGAMLKDAAYATEVLYVCRGSRDPELCTLADQFEAAPRVELARTAPRQAEQQQRPAPQDALWAQNTTGFGLTRPAGLEPLPPATTAKVHGAAARWYQEARRWFS